MNNGHNAPQSFTSTPPPSGGNAADDSSGHHSDGVPVADLIARMGGVAHTGPRTSRHRLTDEPQPDAALQNVVTAPIPGLRRSPIPHLATARRLGATARPRGEINGATTTLPQVR